MVNTLVMELLLFLIILSSGLSQTVPDITTNDINTDDLKLARLDPVAVGHEQTLQLKTGKTVTIKTAAVHPPLFEIENFLDDSECEHIKSIAEKKNKWKESVTLPKDSFRTGKEEGTHKLIDFQTADKNKDNFVDFLEFWYARPPVQNAMITIEDIPEFVQLYNYDVDGDEKLTKEEFDQIDVKLIYEWTYKKMELDMKKQGRISNQVWVTHESDQFLIELKERVASLTGLPLRLINAAEPMQVVHYGVGGHYHAHFDSETINKDRGCIHTRQIDGVEGHVPLDYKKYRLCRYATLMYYLADVDEGGETAFPIADNATTSEEVLFAGGYLGDLSNHCKDANLVVKPKKGKAVLWYNHKLNEDGWIGDKDVYSFHGGCDIIKGIKWIANHWLTVDTEKERQIRYMEFWEKSYGGVVPQPPVEQQQEGQQQQDEQQQEEEQQPGTDTLLHHEEL
ncbi:transmembrane prolyl 4-hydroxylase-like [Antedon mediterranea]|uniref:transmembrane prolyl 4-hydroxylase-like n=1 Tax=Antedon mediterranea TaxID=105859 RepID=UPI003AF7352D